MFSKDSLSYITNIIRDMTSVNRRPGLELFLWVFGLEQFRPVLKEFLPAENNINSDNTPHFLHPVIKKIV